jgi:TonB family protein
MKICPNCQQQFPDGFQYCPDDAEHLITGEEFERRGKSVEQSEPFRAIPSSPTGPIAQASNFGFSIPEQPSLIARLIAGLKSIGDSFKTAPPGQSGAAGDFQFLLKEESLISRISRELLGAWNEFRRNPKVFISEFVCGEGTNRFRRNALLAGSELALTGVVTFYITLQFSRYALNGFKPAMSWGSIALYLLVALPFILFWPVCYIARVFLLLKLIYRTTSGLSISKLALDVVNWTPAVALIVVSLFSYNLYCRVFPDRCILPEEKEAIVKLIDLPVEDTPPPKVKAEQKSVKKAELGGSKSKPKPASGGGGGGRQRPEPPSKGVPPQMALTPQIVLPNPEPPKIKNPTLPVAMTTYGDPSLRMPKGPIGDPTGVPAPPSPGPGSGGGIGRNTGTGVGGGTGGGAGPGRGGNAGGGAMDIGGGRSIEQMTASLRPTILYREKAKYTEEARQNKIQGSVLLQVVFNINGLVTDIKVIRGLPDGLTEKAIEVAKKIRFNPAVKNGAPVSVRGTLDFAFNLY